MLFFIYLANVAQITVIPGNSGLPAQGTLMSFVGFGFTSNENATLPSLQIGSQIALSQSECAAYFPHLNTFGILNQHFCATNTVTRASICGGDQGNGLWLNWLNSKVLLGVSSSNRVANCSAHYPTLHTRIDQYTSWIASFL